MSWAAVIVGGATLVGAAASSRSAGRAADAQGRASSDAIAAQQESERRALEMQRPFYEGGYAATAAMMDMAGLDRSNLGSATRLNDARDRGVLIGDTLLPEGTTTKSVGKGWYEVWNGGQRVGTLRPGGPNGRFINDTGFDVEGAIRTSAGNSETSTSPGDLSSYDKYDWKTDPGYQARLDEGLRVRERSASARGVLNSGGTLRGVERYAQDYASNEYQRVFDRISTIAGRGQSAASQGSQTIVNTGQGVGAALINAGEARASGYVAQGNAWSNAANQGMQLYGYMNSGQRAPISTPPYAGGSIDPYGYYNGNAVRLS
jgi:hypothetical protein